MENLIKSFGWFGGAIVASGAVTYLAKVLIDRLADSGVEAFKAEMRQQHETELERLRAELSRTHEEHRIRFSSLHATRAEVIGELYRKLVRTQRLFASLASLIELSGAPSKDEKFNAATAEAQDLVQYFSENRLYLDPEVARLFGQMERKLHDIWAASSSIAHGRMTRASEITRKAWIVG